jgi:GH24 family phage-related lysozyme (muramidase)
MHESVREIFPDFSKRFEGYVHWMYLDVKGLVTIGIGNLIDPEASAVSLPFADKNTGVAASQAEIRSEWRAVKARQDLKNRLFPVFDPLTRLRLSDAAISALVRKRLAGNQEVLERTFDDWAAWPADAQLGVLSIAWAVGAAFAPKWPKFTAACRAGDWLTAAAECTLREEGNPGVIPRNQANRLLFGNAHEIVSRNLDPARLQFPTSLRPASSAGNAASS